MTRLIIVDAKMGAKLGEANEPAVICSRDGTVLGWFTPAAPAYVDVQAHPADDDGCAPPRVVDGLWDVK